MLDGRLFQSPGAATEKAVGFKVLVECASRLRDEIYSLTLTF